MNRSTAATPRRARDAHAGGCFVIGTDTDVGKTVVTAAIYRSLLRRGISATVIKSVQTGVETDAAGNSLAPDVRVYRDAVADLAVDLSPEPSPPNGPEFMYGFSAPCSPHLASRFENRIVDPAAVVERVDEHRRSGHFTLLEGAGGLLVPLNDRGETVLDLVRATRLPVVLVFANRLGCINHVLLTLRELRRHGVPVLAAVANFVRKNDVPPAPFSEILAADNIATIARFGEIVVAGPLPFLDALGTEDPLRRRAAWDHAADILEPLRKSLVELNAEPPGDGRTVENEAADIAALTAFDRDHLWHPYTSAVDPHPVVPIRKARGSLLFTEDGRELVDGMASWWCAIHGYAHPRLDAAVKEQLDRTAHVMFGGITHRPAVDLARKILDVVPTGLTRIFFADSGSVSVEVALKMALQFQQARGKPQKCRVMTFRGGYHGDTLGAMSVCDPVNGMHTLFQDVLPRQIFLDRPRVPFHGDVESEICAENFAEDFTAMETAFERHADVAAAFILEPVVQGAGGMWFYHPAYLERVRRLCDRHDVLLIADEIATGFGRTGKMFAVEWADVVPDILCIGKALSGGYMTLAAALTTDRVARGISSDGQVFMHGPTFMANPLACAVAGASLELLQTGEWRDEVRRIEKNLREGLEPCREHRGVADVRILGAIGVVETVSPVDTRSLQEFFVDRGVWIRPFGKLLYLMPPYRTDDGQIRKLCKAVRESVETGAWRPADR